MPATPRMPEGICPGMAQYGTFDERTFGQIRAGLYDTVHRPPRRRRTPTRPGSPVRRGDGPPDWRRKQRSRPTPADAGIVSRRILRAVAFEQGRCRMTSTVFYGPGPFSSGVLRAAEGTWAHENERWHLRRKE